MGERFGRQRGAARYHGGARPRRTRLSVPDGARASVAAPRDSAAWRPPRAHCAAPSGAFSLPGGRP
jgi:hypothetical protein